MIFWLRQFAPVLIFALLLTSCNQEKPGSKSDTTAPVVPIDTTLPNGLVIRDIETGSGIPADSGLYFTAHYTGYLSSGDIFDTSFSRGTPISFRLGAGQLVPALELGIKGMRPGGKRILYSPPELGFGPNGIPGIIPPNDTLMFEIEILNVIQPPEPWETASVRERSTDSGITYHVIQSGRGDKPALNDMVAVHYSGYLEDGNVFDSSHFRGDAFRFRVGIGYVISGLDEMVMSMAPGEKRTIFLPPNQAYGENGLDNQIPPNATLRFDVELIEIAGSSGQTDSNK